jgi:chromosome segregation ATPase
MTFLEIVREIILPSFGALAGLGGLIMFIGSRQQRNAETQKTQAETRKTEAEADQIVQLTVGNLHQMTTDAAAQALEAQRGLIDNLQEEIKQIKIYFECMLNDRDQRIQELESKVNRLEKELGVREKNIVALEAKLERYEIENERLSKENELFKVQNESFKKQNESFKKQIESQRKRIKELETQLLAIKKKLEEDNG